MTSTDHRIENVPALPQNVPDGRDVLTDYLESEPSQPSQHLCIDAGRTGRTDGVPQSKKGRHSRPSRDVPNRDVPNSAAPHILLTVSQANRLLHLVDRSRLTGHDETDLVTNLEAILDRARDIEARKNR